MPARLSQLTSCEGRTEVWLWPSASQFPSGPNQLADFCFRSVSHHVQVRITSWVSRYQF